MTLHERSLWRFLRKQSYRVLRQHPIDHYIVDFYVASANLIIEIDGDSHLTERAQRYDQQRTDLLNIYGLEVIRFTNDQIVDEFREVCEEIDEKVQVKKKG